LNGSVSMNNTKQSVAPAHSRKPRPDRDVRQTFIVSSILFVGLGLAIWALGHAVLSQPPMPTVQAVADDTRTGAVIDSANGRCRYFDNDTGRVSKPEHPCDVSRFEDTRTVQGTARRLDAISKSFQRQ
jgi:hypothetical protein